MKLVLAAALMFTALSAQAADVSIAVHGLSYHADRSQTFNETNPGLGVSAGVTDTVSVEAGFYKNSFSNRTEYVAASWLPVQYGAIKAGAMIGAATGYQPQTGHKVAPIAALQANIQVTERVAAVVRWVPPAPNQEKGTSVFAFSVSVAF